MIVSIENKHKPLTDPSAVFSLLESFLLLDFYKKEVSDEDVEPHALGRVLVPNADIGWDDSCAPDLGSSPQFGSKLVVWTQ